MPISKAHGHRKAIDRQPNVPLVPKKNAKNTEVEIAQEVMFAESEKLVDAVYKDIAEGYTRTQLKNKLMRGGYKEQKKPLAQRAAYDIYNVAVNRYCEDVDEEAEKIRAKLLGRYEAVYKEAFKKGDMYNARGALDSIGRIFLGVTRNNIKMNINSGQSKDGSITIKFGFGDADDDEENRAEYVDAEIIEEKDGDDV